MKRLALVSALIALAGTSTATAQIDLTPTANEYTAEGITFRQLSFKDGKRKVVYEPPRQWSYRGGGASLQLTPPNANRADAVIQVTELSKPQDLDEKSIATLREEFIRSLPPGSNGITMTSEECNPVSLENGTSYSFTVRYQVIGEKFSRTVVFVNLPKMQLTFKLTGRETDFERMQKQFRSSILSWHWVETSSAVVQ